MATPAAVAATGAEEPTSVERIGEMQDVKRRLLLGRELRGSWIVSLSPLPQQ